MKISIPEGPAWQQGQRVLEALGAARFVGGCVRDALLGQAATDIDIATPSLPEAVMARLEARGFRVVPTGMAHGTVTAMTTGGAIEITTLRRDLACDGRHAEVAFTDDWIADAARRDFTINALSCEGDGTLHDPFGGAADLASGRVRFVGAAAQRIREDLLRLLRFFRFHGRYGRAPVDAEALAACRELAPLLPGLSGERVRSELFRLLAHPSCAPVWALMIEAGVMARLVPDALRVERLGALVGLEAALALPAIDRPVVRLAALLDTDRAGAEAVALRLRLPRPEGARLTALAGPARPILPDAPPERLRRDLVALNDSDLFRDLALLDAADRNPPLPVAALAPALTLSQRWATTPFPVSGDDLLAQGIAAGPALGRWLTHLRDWWTDQDFRPDREGCLAELDRLVHVRWSSR